MIPTIHLDQDSFEDIFEKAKKRIPVVFPEWSNFNTNDSGIALVELFSWMAEMQEYHMDQIGSRHLLTYLKILGIKPKKKTPSCGLVQCWGVKKNQVLTQGSLWKAGAVPFETANDTFLFRGRILDYRVLDKNGNCRMEGQMDEVNSMNLNIPVFGVSPWMQDTFIITLDTPMVPGRDHGFYVKLKEDYEVLRNPIGENEFIPLVTLSYEYETNTGWEELSVTRDDTLGMLKSGILTLRLLEDREGLFQNKGYRIRIRLVQGEYDVYPVLEKLALNPVEVVQWETAVRTGEKIMIGEGSGFPNQTYSLSTEHGMETSVEIQVERAEKPSCLEKWIRVEDFYRSGPESHHYMVDESTGTVIFGDGIYGMAPEGSIYLTFFRTTLGAGGNIKKGQLYFAGAGEKQSFFGTNETETQGGRDEETIEECFQRLGAALIESDRAVTNEDYEAVIKRTPGLMIQRVRAIDGNNNTVNVVVEPYTNVRRGILTREYRRNIMNYVEKRRLIGTKVILFPPQYIQIFLSVHLELSSYYKDIENLIKNKIYEYFQAKQGEFGKPVIYSLVYGFIESIQHVKRILSLNMETQGQEITRNLNQDVIIPFHGIVHLENIECKLSC